MKINVIKIEEKSDGSATMEVEYDKEFKTWFLKHNKLKRWSNIKFEKFCLDALNSGPDNLELDFDKGKSK